MNVADVRDAIETGDGRQGRAARYCWASIFHDLVVRYRARHRTTRKRSKTSALATPSGERVSLAQLCDVRTLDGASEIYREGNSRYVAIKYSVPVRDLGSTVEEAIAKVGQTGQSCPPGYHIDWAGEYESQKRSQKRLAIVVPITILVICVILFTMFASIKWVMLILANVAMAPIGGLLALLFTAYAPSAFSSGVGFLALFGVSVQTGVIMLEYINQLRARGESIGAAAVNGSVQRLRPIMMTTLVASIGLLPAALSHGIGSDSQRPFAIVIVGGLVAALILEHLPCCPRLYVWLAGENDVLPQPEPEAE